MRFREVKQRTNGNDSRRINFRVRHVVVALDMVEVDGVGDARVLI